jgi:hypothetical protein
MDPVLLTTEQVATFVARGFLAFPAAIPDDLNERATAELEAILATWGTPDRVAAPGSGDPFEAIYPPPSAVGEVLRSPVVAGAIRSLVGEAPVFDHDFVHLRPAHDPFGQHLHCDAMVDPLTAFDIQVFYFPHAVAPDGGGTGFVPGTHLRHVHETDVGRYTHMLGERQWTGPAGSILVFHQGMWHRGMPNLGDRARLMYKIRLNPTTTQVRQWDTSDLEALDSGPGDHVFARFRMDSIAGLLRRREKWMGEADYRLELRNRARLWRYLTGDERFDVDWYLTRQEMRVGLA